MYEYIEVGSAPPDEHCAQVGSDDYPELAGDECRRWIKQLKDHFGEPPKGCFFKIKTFQHDFGPYREVVVGFDDEIPGALEWALNVEGNLPGTWE